MSNTQTEEYHHHHHSLCADDAAQHSPPRTSAYRVSALHLPLVNGLRRSTSRHQDDLDDDDDDVVPEHVFPLPKSASAVGGHREASQRSHAEGSPTSDSHQQAPAPTYLARPGPLKLGPVDVVHEVPSTFASPVATPYAEKPPRPISASRPSTGSVSSARPAHQTASGRADVDVEDHTALGYPDVGVIASWRGIMVLGVTCFAQGLDNVFMTGVNISLPAMQREFGIDGADLQWLISAYTLTFGGFLLLAGVMSDRWGRKNIFCAGMAWLSIWTVACGLASSFIQLAVFRALQGIGAAMTVPAGVGMISAFFVARDRTKALAYFGAAGAVGFCLGLILGGFITSSLGWRYLFHLTVVMSGLLSVIGFFTLPRDRHPAGHARPRLDILGAALSTGGLILLSFVLSSGGEYGWSRAFIIVLLVVSIALLGVFVWAEKKVSNPIMPLSLWKAPNFAALWISGFLMYGGYQTELYFLVLLAQDVLHLSAGATALRLLPMGLVGGTFAVSMGSVMHRLPTKHLLLAGIALCTLAPVPAALTSGDDHLAFWRHLFPTAILGVMGIAIGYCTITVVLLASVPASAQSLCGGMINTAYQLGSGVGLALATAVVQATAGGEGAGRDAAGLRAQYVVGMWCCVGLSGVGWLVSAVGVRGVRGTAGRGAGVGC